MFSHTQKRQICEVKDMLLTRLATWEESFHRIYIYQIIAVYTLNILRFCQSQLNKAEKK